MSTYSREAAKVSTLWRYVRLQSAFFVGGIVGPIFLAVYFASQPEPALKWMYWAGLVVTAADVLLALAITEGGRKHGGRHQGVERKVLTDPRRADWPPLPGV